MAAKQPTNSVLLTEIKGMNTRISALETWKIAEDAAKAAVSAYKQDETKDQLQKGWIEVLSKLSPFLIAATLLIYALLKQVGK